MNLEYEQVIKLDNDKCKFLHKQIESKMMQWTLLHCGLSLGKHSDDRYIFINPKIENFTIERMI